MRQLYEGGFFKAKLDFPKDFPNNPPTMTFVSEMFHPNGECEKIPAERFVRWILSY